MGRKRLKSNKNNSRIHCLTETPAYKQNSNSIIKECVTDIDKCVTYMNDLQVSIENQKSFKNVIFHSWKGCAKSAQGLLISQNNLLKSNKVNVNGWVNLLLPFN